MNNHLRRLMFGGWFRSMHNPVGVFRAKSINMRWLVLGFVVNGLAFVLWQVAFLQAQSLAEKAVAEKMVAGPSSAAMPSLPEGLRVIHLGEAPPKNLDRIIVGDEKAVLKLLTDTVFSQQVLCLRWLSPDEMSAATPSQSAALYEWNGRLDALLFQDYPLPTAFQEWFVVRLSYVGDYPAILWQSLQVANLSLQAQPAKNGVLDLWFVDEKIAAEAAHLLLAWNSGGVSAEILRQKTPPKDPAIRLFYREQSPLLINRLAEYPFWKGRKACG